MSEAQTNVEAFQPNIDTVAALETESLVDTLITNRAAEIYSAVNNPTDGQPLDINPGSAEASLYAYHAFGNLEIIDNYKNPIPITGNPSLTLYNEGNNFSTIKGADPKPYNIVAVTGASMVEGQQLVHVVILESGTDIDEGKDKRTIQIPVEILKDAHIIASENTILSDPKLTEAQKKLIQINNKAKTDGAENVDYSTVKPALKEVAESQGKLLNEPLVQLLTIHKNQPLAEGATPEQQLRHQQKMEKIDKALEQIQESTIATPEGYAAVFSALGPSDIENVIASADATLATDRMTLKNLESQNPPNQQLIADQKTKIQQEEAAQEQRKKSLELFNDQEKLTKYIASIQSGEMKPEVAKKINELMAKGDFRGGIAAMLENKFNQLDDETKKKVLEGLKKFGANLATYGSAGLAIALMVMIIEGLKPQQ